MVIQRKRNYRNRIYANLKAYLDDKLVARGWFDEVASGETDWHDNNLSQVLPVQTDPNYPVDTGSNVHLWQGFRKNWVGAESGVQLFSSGISAPTIAREILINGEVIPSRTFDGVSGIAIDFRNGRVVIESGIAFTSIIEVVHSYKEVWVDTIARDMITSQITAVDNTKRIVVSNLPSGTIGQLPMILMEIDAQRAPRGRQLGGGFIFNPVVFCHIISENRYDKDELIDFLQQRTSETMKMVDYDLAPQQFTYNGDFASGFQALNNLKVNFPTNRAYFEGVSLVENDDIAEDGYYTALLKMELEIWTNEVF